MRVTPPTAWARYLVAQREARKQTQRAVFLAHYKALNWSENSTALYGDMERGKREPTEAERQFFLDLYAPEVPGAEAPTESAPPDLATALAALARELEEARREREHERLVRAAWMRGVVGVLREYAAGQVPEELLDALAPPPHVDALPG